MIHEEDTRGSFKYQASMAHKTPVGTFYPLTPSCRRNTPEGL